MSFCLPEIFLDANATTPVLPEISQIIEAVCCSRYGNPSSPHLAALASKDILSQSREYATALFNAKQGEFIFNSGATEGINTAIFSVLAAHVGKDCSKQLLLYGATEHKAVPEALRHWNQALNLNAQLMAIPVDEEGQLNLAFIREALPQALIICTMGANNETGVIADLVGLNSVIRAYNRRVPWLIDSVQVLGKLPLDLTLIDADYATFSAHKLYGPKGVGALYVHQSANYLPITVGGGQEGGRRGGTENVAGIAALGKIFHWLLQRDNDSSNDCPLLPMSTLQQYRDDLLSGLRTVFPDLVLNQPYPDSLPTTLNFSVPGFSSAQLISLFDAAGIRVSAGSACSTGRPRSYVLDAMGLPSWQSEGAIRMSFGPATSSVFIEAAKQRLHGLAERIQSKPTVRSGLLVPQPTQSNFCVYPQTRGGRSELYIFGDSEGFTEWLHQQFPENTWRYDTRTELKTDELSIRTLADGIEITSRRTQRQVILPPHGLVIDEQQLDQVQIVDFDDLNSDADRLLDVREWLESKAQPVIEPFFEYSAELPRANWLEWLLHAPHSEAQQRYITICRSGGRSRLIAALSAKLGGPELISARLGVTHLVQKLMRTG
ncbi:MAG: aminotransferase class V-fold PLP-dependent enzyme [Aliidiomarina sp.]|uniref:aminotransferase class V-fold PLP-dependent enzyme n=1 Tax=Aliidiomarina sp. TaxID=1872439 RepID=UPI0025C6412B|nr:aminotransferase class V-fold PLP-dependent enzyme [Aliidiomarina sp.]MCH8501389.1 aminotransferase class V-fold PLP-dependent enzyme [Aliidiomarina sp.]